MAVAAMPDPQLATGSVPPAARSCATLALVGLLCAALAGGAMWVAVHWDRPARAVGHRIDPAAAEGLVEQAALAAGYGVAGEVVCPSPPLEKGRVFRCQLIAPGGRLAGADLEIVTGLGITKVLWFRGWRPLSLAYCELPGGGCQPIGLPAHW